MAPVAYREHPVPQSLRGWVAAAWEVTAHADAPAHRILPDGCMDVVRHPDGELTAVGPNSVAFLSPVRAGQTVRGIRLRPGVGARVFGVPAEALRDARPPLEALWGDDGRRTAEDAHGGLDALLDALAARTASAGAPDALVLAAIARLRAEPGLRTARLARELAISERQLRRRFHAEVGYGPKRLARVLRLQRALGLAAQPGAELAEAAAEAGYADQAHFSGDCRALAGVAPGRFLQDRGLAVAR